MKTKDILDNRNIVLLYVLSGFFIANAIVAEFVGGKIFSLESTLGFEPYTFSILGVSDLGFNLTAGVLLWPVVFVMTDLINEYYGKKVIAFLSYLTVVLIMYAFAMMYFAMGLTPNEWWQYQSGVTDNPATSISDMSLSYNKILGQGLWIIVGSMVAFLVGQLVDVVVFHKIKTLTGEKSIWLRATGSTLVSQFIDSFVVLFIAFYIGADWDIVRVLAIGLVSYIYKFFMAVILTPIIYIAHHYIEVYLGHDLAQEMKQAAAL